ncbi:TraB/GumN family protein [Sphaerotilus mobilis]|uniref:Uncharacterized protein YbaP (TraB family) n=1 Tax=Sphaerotilus mobilis TaxID=47994 RepID=A0A4Q7LG18_9BURK|nr:TraB/GumN family protein [Sphaerotilus mobilis]RZS52149.1 uncharacterized protein YbaP (TraB family) [Sphaerotilus mobilis]
MLERQRRRASRFRACLLALAFGVGHVGASASPLLPQALSLLHADVAARDASGNPREGCPSLPAALSDEAYEALLASTPSRGVLLRITHPDQRLAPVPVATEVDADADAEAGEPPVVDPDDAPMRESYLYALPPIALQAWLVPGPEVQAAMASVDRVVFELDLADAAVFDSMDAMARRPLVAADGSRTALPRLPDELALQLQQALSAACLDPPTDWRPEIRALALLTGLMRRDGHEPAYSIAGSLADLAVAMGKPTAGLETPERQLAPLLGEGQDDVAERVRLVLDAATRPETLAALARLQEGYDSAVLGDLRLFERRCNCRQTALEQRLWRDLEVRNAALAEQIAGIHQRGSAVFAAIGALQLTGSGGVIAMLEAQGYLIQWASYPRRPPERRGSGG